MKIKKYIHLAQLVLNSLGAALQVLLASTGADTSAHAVFAAMQIVATALLAGIAVAEDEVDKAAK